jgi:hypothetical protein
MPLIEFIDDFNVWCVLKYCDKTIHLCSAYLPPDPTTKYPEVILDSISATINKLKPKYFLIGSDTNGKSSLWKNRINNRRGHMIIEFMAQNHLYLINNSSKPTYLSSCGESIIDRTLCNYNLFKNVNEWKVEDIETNSDHCYITYSITFDTQTIRTQNSHHIDYYPLKRMNKKLCFKKANWNQFKDLLLENLVKINLCEIRTKILNKKKTL